MSSEEFLKKLRGVFDLNIYEAKIWTALLSKGTATAGELSEMSRVPRSRSYDVLESLEKKGFIMMKLGKPIKYLAIQPEEILKRLKDSIVKSAEDKSKFLDELKSDKVFDELDLLYKQGIIKVEPTSLSGALKGRDNIYYHLRSMLERAEKSITIVTTLEGLRRKTRRFKGLLAKLAEKGVSVRIGLPGDVNNLKEANDLKNFAKIKGINGMNARFIMIDDKEMLFMVSDDVSTHESYDTGIWVNTPYFTKAFSTLFNNAWNLSNQSNGKK